MYLFTPYNMRYKIQNKDNGVKEGGINDGEFPLTVALSPGRCGSVEHATRGRYPATVRRVGGRGTGLGRWGVRYVEVVDVGW